MVLFHFLSLFAILRKDFQYKCNFCMTMHIFVCKKQALMNLKDFSMISSARKIICFFAYKNIYFLNLWSIWMNFQCFFNCFSIFEDFDVKCAKTQFSFGKRFLHIKTYIWAQICQNAKKLSFYMQKTLVDLMFSHFACTSDFHNFICKKRCCLKIEFCISNFE